MGVEVIVGVVHGGGPRGGGPVAEVPVDLVARRRVGHGAEVPGALGGLMGDDGGGGGERGDGHVRGLGGPAGVGDGHVEVSPPVVGGPGEGVGPRQPVPGDLYAAGAAGDGDPQGHGLSRAHGGVAGDLDGQGGELQDHGHHGGVGGVAALIGDGDGEGGVLLDACLELRAVGVAGPGGCPGIAVLAAAAGHGDDVEHGGHAGALDGVARRGQGQGRGGPGGDQDLPADGLAALVAGLQGVHIGLAALRGSGF